MVTTGSVMTVTGSRMQSPVMLEIAVGENSPGFTPSSGSSVLPAPFRTPKKNSGPFSVTRNRRLPSARVTTADVQRVARHYLTPENRTLYALLPEGTAPKTKANVEKQGFIGRILAPGPAAGCE